MATLAARLSPTLICLALLTAGLSACRTPPETPIAGLVDGCAEVLGTICMVEGPLQVWLPGAASFAWVGAKVDAQTPVDGGVRYTIITEPGVSQLLARRRRDAVVQVFELAVRPAPPMPGVVAAREALKARDFAAVRTHLDALDRTPGRAAHTASLRARLTQREGDTARAAAAFEASATAHRAAGSIRAAADDTIVAAYLYIEHLARFDDARRLLQALEVGAYVASDVRRQAFLGHMAKGSGDLRAALRHLRDAQRVARRLGMTRQLVFTELGIAQVLHALGRTQEALAQIDELGAQPEVASNACTRATLANHAGWFRHIAAERRGRVDPKAVHSLERALDNYMGECDRPGKRALVRINLLFACLAAQRTPCANAQRAALRTEKIPPRLIPWLQDADGRLALSIGKPADALTRYTALVDAGDAELTPDLVWRAHVGRAEALLALGQDDAARIALDAAEALLDAGLRGVPLQEGRESFVADRGRSARMLIAVLLTLDKPAEAWRAARRARGRVLSALQATARIGVVDPALRARREAALTAYRSARTALMDDIAKDAERSATALTLARAARHAQGAELRAQLDAAFADLRTEWTAAPRDPARLTLLHHPVPDGWIGFAAQGETVTAKRLPAWQVDGSPAQTAAALLTPFAAEVRAARQIEFMPFGATRAIDLHALPFDGRPLSDTVPVGYALDVAAPVAPAKPQRIAIIVADPRGDLPAARVEADAVAAILGKSLKTEQLRGLAANPAGLRDAAERADVLHYAGHGVFKGARGWESVLPLADGQSLGVGDILALRAVPRLVVLSGCETARSAQGAVEGLGLGQAFVAAGSAEVIAAVRPVPDEAARVLISALHTARSAGQRTARALQTAQAVLRRTLPTADWAAFRLLHW